MTTKAKKLSRDEAEEYTKNLGQVAVGNFGLMEFAMHTLKVPETLGLTNEEWVQERLGGYIRWTVEQRREAVKELSGEQNTETGRWDRSASAVAEILGISENTVDRDREVLKTTSRGEIPAKTTAKTTSRGGKREPGQRGKPGLSVAEKKKRMREMIGDGKTDAEIALALDSGVSTVSKERTAIRKMIQEAIREGHSDAKVAVQFDWRTQMVTDERKALQRKAAGEKSDALKQAQAEKKEVEEEDDTPEHERRSREARLEEFRAGVMADLSKMRGPLGYIVSAIEEIRWFVNEGLEMAGEDEIVRRYIELGRELQVYGARHDIDTAALDEALAAITKEE